MAARGLSSSGPPVRFGPEVLTAGGEVDLTNVPHPETRHFTHGGSLLGYLEGRAGVVALREVEGWKPDGWTGGAPPAPTAAQLDRMAELPIVREAGSAEEREERLAEVLAAWLECEDGGAWVTFDVDSDSPVAE